MSSRAIDKKYRLSTERNRALTKKLIDMGMSFQDWVDGHVSILLDGEVSPGVTTAEAIVDTPVGKRRSRPVEGLPGVSVMEMSKPQVERLQHRGPITKAMQVGKEKKRDG